MSIEAAEMHEELQQGDPEPSIIILDLLDFSDDGILLKPGEVEGEYIKKTDRTEKVVFSIVKTSSESAFEGDHDASYYSFDKWMDPYGNIYQYDLD